MLFFSIPKMTLQKSLKSIEVTDLEMKLPFCHYAELNETSADELLSTLHPTTSINFFEQQGKLLNILGEIQHAEIDVEIIRTKDLDVKK